MLIVSVCVVTAMWLFGGGIAQALKELGLGRGILRGLVVGVVATVPLPIFYAMWWRAHFTANIAVQVGVFGLISGIDGLDGESMRRVLDYVFSRLSIAFVSCPASAAQCSAR